MDLKNKNLLTLIDYSQEEIKFLLDLSIFLKKEKKAGIRKNRLQGLNISLIFEKPSTRTRCAFIIASNDEGAHAEYLGKGDIQLGKKESVKDTARVLGRMFDGIEFRGYQHSTVEELAAFAGVPVWNGLTDRFHPTQALADLMTILEAKGHIKGIRLAYMGDGRSNMANSLLIGAAKMGMDFRLVSAKELQPESDIIENADRFAEKSGGKILITSQINQGIKDADVIYTDVWASMGEEDKIAERIALLKPFRVTRETLDKTGNPDCIFLHCLPSFHNQDTSMARQFPDICETAEEVFEGKNSLVFEQAENRVHTIKAVMISTLGRVE